MPWEREHSADVGKPLMIDPWYITRLVAPSMRRDVGRSAGRLRCPSRRLPGAIARRSARRSSPPTPQRRHRALARVFYSTGVSVQDDGLGRLVAHRHRHGQRRLDQVGAHMVVDRPADHSPQAVVTYRHHRILVGANSATAPNRRWPPSSISLIIGLA
jgi:hypothetical protein